MWERSNLQLVAAQPEFLKYLRSSDLCQELEIALCGCDPRVAQHFSPTVLASTFTRGSRKTRL
jgi:hypothetical protein